MSRFVGTSLLLLALIGFGSCQDEYNFNDSCIKVQWKMEARITYLMANNTNNTIIVKAMNYSSSPPIVECDSNMASIEVTFMDDFILTIDFYANGTDSWSLGSLTFQYMTTDNQTFPNPSSDGDILNGTNTAIRNVGWGKSFKCNRNIRYDLTSEESTGTAIVMFNPIQLQVFNFTTSGEFDAGRQCSTGSSSDDKVVPIAVGCALAGLVVIVLIAYLIGRFRSRNTDSYQVLS